MKRRLNSLRPPSPAEREISRLGAIPPKTPCSTTLLGVEMALNDAPAFVWMYQQTYQNHVCRFRTRNSLPLILDCGANVGVTVHYWKHLYPKAKIIAFEPDPMIFKMLEKNCRTLSDVELHNCAAWIREETLRFNSNDSLGGRLSHLSDQGETVRNSHVPAVRLRDFLDRKVDFLKIDIEGAEVDVIPDCADRLHNVDQLFLEYHSFTDRPQNLTKVLKVIEDAGFRMHIHTELPAARPFMERPVINGKDLRLDVFAFRDTANVSAFRQS